MHVYGHFSMIANHTHSVYTYQGESKFFQLVEILRSGSVSAVSYFIDNRHIQRKFELK